MVQFYTTEFARIHALLINMYNVRVTEVGVPVSFKVLDALFCARKRMEFKFRFRLLH